MIKVRARVHDKFSIEFKVWFQDLKNPKHLKIEENIYKIDSWIFVPGSLDINSLTYSREQFYSDIKNYYRTITPVFNLSAICKKSPYNNLLSSAKNLIAQQTTANIAECDYQIKMFSAIFKSAIREEYILLKKDLTTPSKSKEEKNVSVRLFAANVEATLRSYRNILIKLEENNISKDLYNLFGLGEEFMLNLYDFYLYKINEITQSDKDRIINLEKYKQECGYDVLTNNNPLLNSNLVYRWGVLKKYVESDLFLGIDKRKSGVITEQVYYSLAAGLSMIFATVISFFFQQKYGNFTTPFFLALVISYMLKDRIKEIVRYLFTNNRKIRYYDNKITLSIKDQKIGESREGFDIIPQSKVPAEIMDIRNRSYIVEVENKIIKENILFYRNRVCLDKKVLEETSKYKINGINEIIYFNLWDFVKKMDNPQVPHFIIEQNEIEKILVDKVYYLNFVFRFTSNAGIILKRYRIMINRNGIIQMEEIE